MSRLGSTQQRLPSGDSRRRPSHVRGAQSLRGCALLLMMAAAGCAGDDHKRPPSASNDLVDTSETATPRAEDPFNYGPPPSEPCPTLGEKRECGRVYQTDGDYVTCSVGYQTCTDGSWSDCVGDHLVVKTATPAQ
jgi:hypothetical protein